MNRRWLRNCGIGFSILTMPTSALSAAWNIQSHNRVVSAISTARIDSSQVSDSDFQDQPGFGLFASQIQANASITDNTPGNERFANAGAGASQTSVLASNRITVSGFAAGTSDTDGMGTFAETDAFSDLFVQFEVTEAAAAQLTGSLESFDFGQANVSFTGPSGLLFSTTVQGLTEFLSLDETWLLAPGVYTFSLNTFADSAAGGAGAFDGQRINFDLDLSLLECAGPIDPTEFENVAYGITAASDAAYLNLDLINGQPWATAGAMGSGSSSGAGLAFDPITSVIYALAEIGGVQTLVTLNPNSGTIESSVAIFNPDPFAFSDLLDIAFRPDGTLYGIYSFLFVSAQIGTVDINSGVVAPFALGTVGHSSASGSAALAFDPVGGLLYNAAGSALWTIDVDTGSFTEIPLGSPPAFTSLAFHPDGLPFIACTEAGAITTIDPLNGTVADLPGVLDPPADLSGLDFAAVILLGGDPASCHPSDGNLGDMDGDGQAALGDLMAFAACMTGPGLGIGSSSCLTADMQTDGDIDLADYAEFERLLSAP